MLCSFSVMKQVGISALNINNQKKNMKKNMIFSVALIAALTLSNSLNAKDQTNDSNDQEKNGSQELVSTNYSRNSLLNILSGIQNDLENRDIKAIKAKGNDISTFLKARKGNNNLSANQSNKIEKLLELEYGDSNESKTIFLPLRVENKPLRADNVKENINIYHFNTNEITNAKIRYVVYDDSNVNLGSDLSKLLVSVKKGNEANIRKEIKNVYKDIFRDSDENVSLVPRIRDNLTLASYLVNNKQSKAAQTTVEWTDSLIVLLVEATSDNSSEQKKIKNLREDVKDLSKVSDEDYISKWEKLDERLKVWWKKNKS